MFAVGVSIYLGGIMRQVCLFTICSVLILPLPAAATIVIDTPSLGDVLGDGQFDNVGSNGQYYLSLNGGSGIQSVEFSILNEEKNFAKWNRIGIYDHANPSEMLEIFRDKDKVGNSLVVTFDLDKGQAWIKDDKGKGKGKGKKKSKKISIGPEFGFYIDSGKSKRHGGMFYSESSLNTDASHGHGHGVPHTLIFDIEEAGSVIENIDMVIAFENMRINAKKGSFDGKYNDLVIGVSSTAHITVVPEPATIAMLGLGYLVFLKRKP